MSAKHNAQEIDFSQYPICVDLDGTLWNGDCLWLCARKFLKRNPFHIAKIFLWWGKSRWHLKHNLLKHIIFDAKELAYFPDVLNDLISLKNQGARLYLVTGSDQAIANQVAQHLDLFEKAYGSTAGTNLVGNKKAELLNELFGINKYIYFGNEWKDRLVWKYCAAAGCVNVDNKTLKWLAAQGIYIRRFICK